MHSGRVARTVVADGFEAKDEAKGTNETVGQALMQSETATISRVTDCRYVRPRGGRPRIDRWVSQSRTFDLSPARRSAPVLCRRHPLGCVRFGPGVGRCKPRFTESEAPPVQPSPGRCAPAPLPSSGPSAPSYAQPPGNRTPRGGRRAQRRRHLPRQRKRIESMRPGKPPQPTRSPATSRGPDRSASPSPSKWSLVSLPHQEPDRQPRPHLRPRTPSTTTAFAMQPRSTSPRAPRHSGRR